MEIVPKTSHEFNDQVRQEQVVKKDNEFHLIGKQRKVAGHTLYEFNKATKEIKPAAVNRRVIVNVKGKEMYVNKTVIHKGCFYLQALNVNNAKRKLRKLGLLKDN